jgi:putative spermidine/putrescine transport system permease protein
MVAPAVLLLAVFFAIPILELLRVSLLTERPSPRNPAPAESLINYVRVFGDSFYLRMTLNSIILGICTTTAVLLIGYPIAFYLTRAGSYERTLISVACLLPMFINVIVGILGWYILLLPFGVVQQILSSIGLVSGPLLVLRTFPALVGVLTYEHIPFAILILVASLQAIRSEKINAARSLGAGTMRIIWTIILPMTMPGLVATAILVFSLSTSSYLTPILIGANRVPVLPLAIFSYGTELLNWPLAATLSFTLLVLVAVISYAFAAAMSRLTRRGAWEIV